jgi:hypothetical protein
MEDMKMEKRALLEKRLGATEGKETKPIDLMDCANELYEDGISCLDFVEWIETKREKWTANSLSAFMIKYHQMKTNFRCEKLLLFAMLARMSMLDVV